MVFAVSDKELGLSASEATITLLIGGQDAVVANVTRGAKEPKITFYSLDYSTYEEYEVDTTQPLEIEWNETNFGFLKKLRFVANFDWKIEGFPKWISNPESYPIATEGGASDEFMHILTTDYAAYTDTESMEATINVVSKANPEISFPLTLTTRGAKDLMQVTHTDGFGLFSFDTDGTYGSALDDSRLNFYDFSYVAAAVGSFNPIYIISCAANGDGTYTFDSESTYADSWVWVDPSETTHYDDDGNLITDKDEDIIYNDYLIESFRKVEVGANSGKDRAAVIIVLPTALETAYQRPTDFYTADGSLKGEVEEYVVAYIEQKGTSGSSLEFAWPPMISATIGAMSEVESSELYWHYVSEFGIPEGSVYTLTYDSAGAAQIKFPFAFDMENDMITVGSKAGDSSWLTSEPGEGYFTISMQAEGAAEGYVILKQGWFNKVAIHCVQKAK